MPGIFAAISFTPSRTCFLSAAETPSFHWITDTWMIVFGVPKLFCATSQVAVALSDISVVTTAMRINVVIEDLLLAARGESLAATLDFQHGLLDRSIRAEYVPRIAVEIPIREISGRFRNSALEKQEQAR